jgi:hypothetical protein
MFFFFFFFLISDLLSVEAGPHVGLYILSMLLLWPLCQFRLCLPAILSIRAYVLSNRNHWVLR